MNGAATYSKTVDDAFVFILGAGVLLLIGVTVTMILFIVRYRRSRNPDPAQIEGNIWLETLWTVLPTILVMVMFYYGWTGFKLMRDIPEDALEVTVKARMWSWLFEYPNGKQTAELLVPTGEPVVLNLESTDVIHSFFVPAFRLKEDAMPGRTNRAWFETTRDGEFTILCAEYCGELHSQMLSKVRSIPAAEFADWLGEVPEPPTGEELLSIKGCLTCHSLDGAPLVGPTFKGLFGKRETVLTDGKPRTITVDEAYLERSILRPKADIVEGFQPLMPEQADLISEDELEDIIETIKGLK